MALLTEYLTYRDECLKCEGLDGTYDYLYIKKINNIQVAVLAVKCKEDNHIIADINFKKGFLDISFIKKYMLNHKGCRCLVTIDKTNLKARILANSLDFVKLSCSKDIILYGKLL
jgi:response regulator of citrate/malate metabolism